MNMDIKASVEEVWSSVNDGKHFELHLECREMPHPHGIGEFRANLRLGAYEYRHLTTHLTGQSNAPENHAAVRSFFERLAGSINHNERGE